MAVGLKKVHFEPHRSQPPSEDLRGYSNLINLIHPPREKRESTGTSFSGAGILSPVRLPVSPPGRGCSYHLRQAYRSFLPSNSL